MKEILCSTGAIIGGANKRYYKILDEFSKKLSCDGFELMIYRAWYENIEDVVDDIRKMSLNIPVIHCDKHIGEMISIYEEGNLESAISLFEINCQVAADIGASKMVMHLWGGLPSDQNIKNNISTFAILDKIAKKHGIILTVENVVCNREEPMSHLLELYKTYPDIAFTLDTKMAAFHNQIDMIYEKEWSWMWEGGHIKHLHINDYKGGYKDWQNLKTLHIGEGKVDFDKFFNFVNEVEYSGDFTIEATSFNKDGEVDFDKINNSINIIKSYIS